MTEEEYVRKILKETCSRRNVIWRNYTHGDKKKLGAYEYFFIDKNDIIRSYVSNVYADVDESTLKKYVKQLGYNPYEGQERYRFNLSWTICDLLERFTDKPFEEFEKEIESRAKQLARRRSCRKYVNRTSFFDELDPVIIGLDRAIDIFPTGFNVRIICSSESTFIQRKDYVSKNKTQFLECVMRGIEGTPCISRRIKSLSFFRPVEIVCLRIPEIEVKFEVKGEVNDQL